MQKHRASTINAGRIASYIRAVRKFSISTAKRGYTAVRKSVAWAYSKSPVVILLLRRLFADRRRILGIAVCAYTRGIGVIHKRLIEPTGKLIISMFNRSSQKQNANARIEHVPAGDDLISEELNELKCRVNIEHDLEHKTIFTVQLRGKIEADKRNRRGTLSISMIEFMPEVNEHVNVIGSGESHDEIKKPFEYKCDLGRFKDTVTEMADWISVARVKTQWLTFARRGIREITLRVKVLCSETNEQLASCKCDFQYNNPVLGYIDAVENSELAWTKTITLALALCAVDGRMYKDEIDTIRSWARLNSSDKEKKVDKAVDKIVSYFQNGKTVSLADLAVELYDLCPPSDRYSIIELIVMMYESKDLSQMANSLCSKNCLTPSILNRINLARY